MAVAKQYVEFHDKQIAMSHGAGGEASRRLVEGLFQPLFSNPLLGSPWPMPPRLTVPPAGWP